MSRTKKRLSKAGAFLSATVLAGGLLGSTAMAAHQPPANMQATRVFTTELNQLNNSGDNGYTTVAVNGNQATFKIYTTGTSPNLPHAQHLHFDPDATMPGFCPDISADTNNDNIISALEGVPSYGNVQISLTTTGDTGPASGLAVERFPVSNDTGEVTYERTVTLPDIITADNIADGVIVQHGISELFDNPAVYDGEKRSSLDATLPLEASVPASCGALTEITDEMPEEAPVKNVPAAPVVSVDANNSTVVFNTTIITALDELRSDGHAVAADEFNAAYTTALDKFTQRVATAANDFNNFEGSDMHAARNQYIDTLNNAKAMFFNDLDVAKNQLAVTLSGKDDVAKDMFMNKFNQTRDMFGNKLEVMKNDFVAKLG